MKILMIADTAPPLYGGAGAQAALLASRLRSRGDDVILLARQKSRVGVAPEGTVFARPFIRSPRLSRALFAIEAGWRVLTSDAEIVHCHGAYTYAWTAVMAARARRIPCLVKVTLIGSDDPATVGARRLGPLPIGRWMSALYRHATRVIVMNEHLAHIVGQSAPAARLEIMPNGVELPAPRPRSDTELRLAFAGILSRRKGVDTLLEAWPTVLAEHPDATLTLIGPAGDIPAEAWDLPGVTATGLVDPRQARRHLDRASLFVLPSRQEGQPNALVEAMSMGIPAIASDIPENRATGGDAVTYFAVGESAALVNAIERAWRDRAAGADRGRNEAARFDIERVVERCSELYRGIRRTRPRRRDR